MPLLFVACAVAMTLAALAFVLLPLTRRRSAGGDERLRALDAARAAGVLDGEEYARKRAALPPAPAASPAARGAPLALILGVALLVPATSVVLYRWVGTPAALVPQAPRAVGSAAGSAGEHASAADMQQAVAALAARLKQEPGDVEGWALLGRAYATMGDAAAAVDAWRHAHDLAPTDTTLSVELAQALALAAPDHRLAGEARQLLEAVAGIEPNNQRALWLLGISDYQDGHFAAAVARWNTLLPLVKDNANVADAVRAQIAQAQAQLDGKPAPAPARAPAGASAATAAAAAAPPVALTVEVRVDPKLAARVDGNATLFVFARAANGPPMPLAIARLKAADLPTTVKLDDSMGMLPSLKLSDVPEIIVGARISRSGQATPQSGDLQASTAPLDVHRSEPIRLTIDSVVP